MKKSLNVITRKNIKILGEISPFKGQKGQDKWVIFTVLPFKRNGFFLDIAAADGITHSNTYVLEKFFGWNGICVEPNPIFFQKLKEKRHCIVDASVVSDKYEKVNFRIDNGQLGGIIAEDTDNNSRVRSQELLNAETITLDTVILNDLLERHNAPKIIDYFSLDVEGSEERVIRSLDFRKYQFSCITIERPTSQVNRIILDNDYVFVKNYRFDSFYVHSSIAKEKELACEPFEQIPSKDW